MTELAPSPTTAPVARNRPGWQIAFSAWNLAVYASWVILPFALARSPGWLAGWLHLCIVVAGTVAESVFVARKNPVLKARRKQIGAGTKTWDLAWNIAFWPLMASIAIVGGLQHRANGSSLPVWAWPAGVAVVASGFALSAWSMGTNPHFEGTVRIQTEVGHRVFEGGPYRFVRHPGYVGLVLWALGTPLLVLSVWSLVAAVVAAAWIVLRTALEDATLRRELPGYEDYSRRTRFRLVPWLW
jgi:protein-S-isoprenylcysteine O-methyltransferase Ste14